MKKKIHILVLYWGKKGGGAHYSLKLSEELTKYQDVGLYLSISNHCEILSSFKHIGVPLFMVKTYKRMSSFLYMLLFRQFIIQKEFSRFLTENKIDVIIIGMDFFWGKMINRSAKKAGVSTMFVVHEPHPHPGEPYLMKIVKNWRIKHAIRESNHVVTLSNHVKSEVLNSYHIHDNQISVIPHGVFSYYRANKPRELNVDVSNEKIRVLYFGRIEYYKGLDILLKAFRLLEGRFSNISLEIWGEGNLGKYDPELSAISNKRVENRWISEAEIVQIFRECDICVLPYRDASQTGIAGIAAHAAMPIVACPSNGLREQLEQTGALFSDDFRPESLADRIELLIRNPDLYHQLSDKSLHYAKELSWEKIASIFKNKSTELAFEPKIHQPH